MPACNNVARGSGSDAIAGAPLQARVIAIIGSGFDMFFSRVLRMGMLTTAIVGFGICASLPSVETIASNAPAGDIGPPPEELRIEFCLAPFYQKYLDLEGMPIVSSAKVRDEALREAARIVRGMLQNRPDILRQLARNKVRLAIMAPTELTTDIPEHADLIPKSYWDRRARGLGATFQRPAVSCGEENLLNLPGDRYDAENILVHEFAHAIHIMGLNSLDRSFERRLKRAYARAMDRGLWKGTYAATNFYEYWAEGVQSYFDTNRRNDREHNDIDTREKLAKYDPALYRLIDSTFRSPAWRYVRFDRRKRR